MFYCSARVSEPWECVPVNSGPPHGTACADIIRSPILAPHYLAPLSPLFPVGLPPGVCRETSPCPMVPAHRGQCCTRPGLHMTSVTIRTPDGPLGLSQRFSRLISARACSEPPSPFSQPLCWARRKTGFPRLPQPGMYNEVTRLRKKRPLCLRVMGLSSGICIMQL